MLEHWLFDPAVGKLAAVLIGIVLVIAGVKAMQRLVNQYVRDTDTRYRGARRRASSAMWSPSCTWWSFSRTGWGA